jgi:hypothetical protein
MVKYKFSLTVKDNDSLQYTHEIDLKGDEEDKPEKFFAKPEHLKNIKDQLQKKSNSRINEKNLDKIIAKWTSDIKVGWRDSRLTLELPLLAASDLDKIDEHGNQDQPTLIEPNLEGIEPVMMVLPPLDDF